MSELPADFDIHRLGPCAVDVQGTPRVAIARYFYRLKEDDLVTEFCVAGATGPQSVETLAPDGSWEVWKKHWEGDLLVFTAPSGYAGSQPIRWMYDKRLQFGRDMGRAELERYALRHRVSFDMGSVG